VGMSLILIVAHMFFVSSSVRAFLNLASTWVVPSIIMWAAAITFFALDSDGSIRRVMQAYLQGAKMMVYILPIYVIVLPLYKAIWWISLLPEHLLPCDSIFYIYYAGFWAVFLMAFLMPFFVCIMSVIYTKKVHDNSELYN
jgi:hypothetical protein